MTGGVKLGDAWINPAAVASIIPSPSGGCVLQMLAGPQIQISDASADEIADRVFSETYE